ncbi:hypothetical protein HDU98_003682 [Podochytrium sp. JEL0797]|nr:hypothetical protein HDU98_003682 [Podochytrium sp. JEL0797]
MDELRALYATEESSLPQSPTPHFVSKDSPSLWNASVNKGWSTHEEDTLCTAILKFGVGNWRAILDSNCLPGKNPSQMYLQVQRILGQQSISEFTGLHLDIREIGKINKARTDVVRKNRLITNSGVKMTREQTLKKLKENKERFEVPESEWSAIHLPHQDSVTKLIAEKRMHLHLLEVELGQVRDRIIEIKEELRADDRVESESLSDTEFAVVKKKRVKK